MRDYFAEFTLTSEAVPKAGGAMRGYLIYALTTRISATMTAASPIRLNTFCQSTQRSLFSIRWRKNILNG